MNFRFDCNAGALVDRHGCEQGGCQVAQDWSKKCKPKLSIYEPTTAIIMPLFDMDRHFSSGR